MKNFQPIEKSLVWLKDALFPTRCVNCGICGNLFCSDCLMTLKFPRRLLCPECADPTSLGEFCDKCKHGHRLDGLWVSQYYGNPLLRNAVRALKFDYLTELSLPLGRLMAVTLKAFELPPKFHSVPIERWFITAVPLAPRRLRERNFNQAELMATVIAKQNDLALTKVLVRNRYTKPQTDLPLIKREGNVMDAFTAKPGSHITGNSFIVVDDVYTSGATLEACAKALKSAGAIEVWGLVAAKG